MLTLALGIGANTAIFSIIDGVLLRPLAFNAPGQLYTLWERNLKMGYEQNPPAAANFRDWRERNHVFEDIAAFDASATFDLSGDNKPERVDGAAVSPELFDLLGARPILGRSFSPQEDELGRERVAELSYGLWRRRFHADPSIFTGRGGPLDGSNIAAKKMTRINYAFFGLQDGLVTSRGANDAANLATLVALKKINHELEVVVSVGGGGEGSAGFSDMAITSEGRRRFVDSAIAVIELYKLDGIDIDWEYPGYTHAKTTVRATTWYNSVEKNTGHDSPLDTNPADPKAISIDQAVKMNLAAGVPAHKIAIGVPFYGRMWTGVESTNNGLFQPIPPTAAPQDELAYFHIAPLVNAQGYVRYWDPISQTPYLYNAETKTFITYNDAETELTRTKYVGGHHLGGIMFWQYAHDPGNVLLGAIDQGFGMTKRR